MNHQKRSIYLESIFTHYHRRELVHPDPLEFLYRYPQVRDREVVGLVAASLAYGTVKQILSSVSFILDFMGETPGNFLEETTDQKFKKYLGTFKHRWHTADDLAGLLTAIKSVLKNHGSLNALFLKGYDESHPDIFESLCCFVETLRAYSPHMRKNLLPLPQRGSACKRLLMYLRWMVRCDEVDPGGWKNISPAKLIVPLDTHMHTKCLELGFTKSKQANLKTAREVTNHFRKIAPTDPVKYDFCLTRPGIRKEKF